MNPDTTPTPTWKVCKAFNSALLEDEKEGERLNEIFCANRDEAECLVDLLNGKERELAEKTNEVARLREELQDIKDGMKFIMDEKCAESEVHCGCVPLLKISFKKSEQEVARLRGLLKDHATFLRKNGFDRQADDLMRFAPAPEEPVIQDSQTTEHLSQYKKTGTNCQFCGSEVAKNKEFIFCLGNPKHTLARIGSFRDLIDSKYPVSNSEWRELGADEVIQEGDEMWITGSHWTSVALHIGHRASSLTRVRTRRPLPKPIEIERVKKQEEMSLEDEIEQSLKLLDEDPYSLDTDEKFGEVVLCLRYLRDEIQKLKQTKTRPRLIGPF